MLGRWIKMSSTNYLAKQGNLRNKNPPNQRLKKEENYEI